MTKGYSAPCLKCGARTSATSQVCPPCRTAICAECRTNFRAHRLGAKICSQCQAKARNRAKTAAGVC
jgi:hypothetical protein